jgi:hypothetical protein
MAVVFEHEAVVQLPLNKGANVVGGYASVSGMAMAIAVCT